MFLKRLVIISLSLIMCLFGAFSLAGCSEKTFTVRFEGGADDASLYYGQQIQVVSSSSQIVEPIYIRPGYNFVGWNRSISLLSQDSVVIAQWKAYEFEVTFNANGGKDGNGNKVVVVRTDSAYNLVQNQPNFIKDGYDLSWDIDLNQVTRSCSVNAIWTPKTFDLVFKDIDGNDFDGNKAVVNYNGRIGDITIMPPQIQNQRFAYWVGQESGLPLDKGIIWKDKEGEIFVPVYVSDSDYLIKYDINGGQRAQKRYSYNEQDEGAKIIDAPFREGYAFNGWLINDSTVPKLSQDITIDDFKIDGNYSDVVLTAVWESRPYKISFDTDGGTLNGEEQKEVWFETLVGELPTAEKEGYVFFGWQYNNEIVDENTIYDIPSDVTLKAVYKAIYYVRFSLTSTIGKDNTKLTCKVVRWGGVVNDGQTKFEDVVFELIEGQSLHSRYGFEIMPVVDPVEPKGQNNYVFGNIWQTTGDSGEAYKINQSTIFNAENLGTTKAGETIVLVPFCKVNWSPRY